MDDEGFHGMVGRSPVMQSLFAELCRVAVGRGPVLIEGESGVGKELAARAIHEESERAEGPFLAVNCAGVPDSLLESEFFGHVEGAFSGASGTRAGLFQEADGGTLLLDEIGEMSKELQAKLLRVLEDGRVRPVGSDRSQPVDVRVIAATNRDPGASDGSLRRDLFYRLATFRISVPPLRAREGDIDLLVVRFIRRHAARLGREAPEPGPRFLGTLRSHPFPGNVRELENVVERAVTFCEGRSLQLHHLPVSLKASAVGRPGPSTGEDLVGAAFVPENGVLPTLRDVEDRYIRYVLDRVEGNKRRAAALLGIARRTLYRRLAEDE
jgi:transcriptional regulator with PAS, ATPase and Fis domain